MLFCPVYHYLIRAAAVDAARILPDRKAVSHLRRKLISAVLSVAGFGVAINVAANAAGGFDKLPAKILEITAAALDGVGFNGAAASIRETFSSQSLAAIGLSELKAEVLSLDSLAGMAGLDLSSDSALEILSAEDSERLNGLVAELNDIISLEKLAELAGSGENVAETDAVTREQIESMQAQLKSGGVTELLSPADANRLSGLIDEVNGLVSPGSLENLAGSGLTVESVTEQLNNALDTLKSGLDSSAADSLLPDDGLTGSGGLIDEIKGLFGGLG